MAADTLMPMRRRMHADHRHVRARRDRRLATFDNIAPKIRLRPLKSYSYNGWLVNHDGRQGEIDEKGHIQTSSVGKGLRAMVIGAERRWSNARQELQSSAHVDRNFESADRLQRVLHASPILLPIFKQWSTISLPDCWLVAGVVAQTVWNNAHGFAPGYGLSDIDLVYFDESDLSDETEARHAERLERLFAELPVKIDVKNEARVHIWYASKFGYAIRPYTSTTDAITTFPTTATAIGVQPQQSVLSIFAPFGLSDLLGLIVRPNKIQIIQSIYEAKVARWRSLWPQLAIVDWAAP